MMKEYQKTPNFSSILGIEQTFNLTDADLRQRGQSFLDRQTLERAGLRRVSDDLGHQILGIDTRKKGIDYAGIIIPYFDVEKAENIVEVNLRRDNPERTETGDGKIKFKRKYVKARTTNNLLYVAPMMPRDLIGRGDIPKVFFEGEFKVLAAARVASENFTLSTWHFIPLAISGVDNFRTKQKRTLGDGEKVSVSAGLPEFNHFTWHGSRVVILFDSDVNEKPTVKGARNRCKKFFQDKGAKVFIADLPKDFDGIETKGFDDYLGAVAAKHSEAEAIKAGLELIKKALNPKPKGSPLAQNYKLVSPGETDEFFPSAGVWYDDDETKFFVCSPLKIVAETQTDAGENYGRFLEWTDSKNRVHSFAMPIEQIHGENTDLIKYLVSRGLQIGTTRKHYEHLRTYINLSSPDRTIISTDKIGWNGGAFVLPDEVFGGDDEITFQSEFAGFDKFQTKGTLADWRENIGKFCAGNSRLAFAVSVAFACPLLSITETPGGGFHNRGTTSTGKTTALLVAGSVCGGSDEMHGYCQTWKATANGLEILAAGHNHLLLCLDEIGECEAREVGNIAYMLSNGQGKNRMARNTARRKSYSWHLLFLSSGERRLSDIMTEAGQKVRGGQEIRLCDIEADTGKNGMFEELHGFADGRSFSDHLRECSREYYGTPLREFLRNLVEYDRDEIKSNWREFQTKFLNGVIVGKQPGEVLRVASRFALVAFAGEMATALNITGWGQNEATRAACQVFAAWLNGRQGNGNSDAENAIRQVRLFLEKHGQSRFQLLGDYSVETEKVINHAGYRRTAKDDSAKIEYLVFPETFRAEVSAGYDSTFTARALAEKGFLSLGADGKSSRSETVGGTKRRFYIINSSIFSDETELKTGVPGVLGVP